MIARCNCCGREYDVGPNAVLETCGNCGSHIFWVLHFELWPKRLLSPYHEVMYNLLTGEKLSDDPCDYLEGK